MNIHNQNLILLLVLILLIFIAYYIIDIHQQLNHLSGVLSDLQFEEIR